MATFLILIPPHFGHINPTLGIGAELLSRNHRVIWMGFRALDPSLLPTGGEYIFPAEFAQEAALVEGILRRQDEAAKNTANRMIKWAFESTWLPFCHLTMKYLPDILAKINPDVIFHDEGLVGAAMCASMLGTPYATSISSAPGLYYPPAKVLLPEDADWLQEVMQEVKRAYRANTTEEILNSPSVNIVYTARDVVSGEKFPANYHFIGPALEGRPERGAEVAIKTDSARKQIYVSTGSLLKEVKQQFYAKVIDAFADSAINVLVTADQDLFDQWPANFTAKPFWPQLKVLSQVDAVVTPCGFNTMNEALFFGKPLLAIPLANDQFGNGQLVEHLGCGLRLRYRRLTAQQLRDSVERLLTDDQFSRTAERISLALRHGGGSKKGADLLESLLTSGH